MLDVKVFFHLRPLSRRCTRNKLKLSENKFFPKLGTNSNRENCLGESLNSAWNKFANNIVGWMNWWFFYSLTSNGSKILFQICLLLSLHLKCSPKLSWFNWRLNNLKTTHFTSKKWMINLLHFKRKIKIGNKLT